MTKILKAKTKDVAISYRMGAGFPGDVSRTHPVDIMPSQIDITNPPTAFGQATILDATSHNIRKLLSTDTGITSLYGITVRPFPFQQAQTSQNFGATQNASGSNLSVAPPVSGEVDVMVRGFAIVQVGAYGTTAPVKGGAVYVWIAASSGSGSTGHTQGNFEAAATGGSTIALTGCTWNSGVDANGNAEIAFNI